MRPLSQRLWKTVRNLITGTGARRVRAKHRSWVPQLESRALLAGTAIVTQSGGTLTITGVDDLTPAGITGLLNNQEITITGGGAGTVTVAGVGTTVTGAGLYSGVTAIKIDLKLGDDIATLTNVQITGVLTYLGGDGNNDLTLNGASGHTYGSIVVTNGDGGDEIRLTGTGDLSVTGAVTISNGEGEGFVQLGDNASSDVSLGSFKYAALDGSDKVAFQSGTVAIAGTTQITTGEGTTDIDLKPSLSLALGGATTITAGHDFNQINIGDFGSVSGKAVTITTGNGNSEILLRGIYAGAIGITNGNGFDDLQLNALTVTGNVTIKNGAGGSETDFKDAISIAGSLSITNGNGEDRIGDDSASWSALSVTGGVTLANGAGGSRVKLAPTGAFTVGGSLSVTSGNGDDEVFVEPGGNTTIGGSVTYSTGNGEADLDISGLGNTTINGSVSVTNGEGDLEFDLFVNNAKTLQVLGTTTITAVTGNDSVEFFTGDTANATMLLKNVSINLGDGDSDVKFEGFGGTTTIDGTLTVKAGPGRHEFDVDVPLSSKTTTINLQGVGLNIDPTVELNVDKNWTVTGDWLITTNQGNDQIEVNGALIVSGKTTVSTGSGDDFVSFEGSTATSLTGAVTINMGAGSDGVQFDRSTIIGNLIVNTGSQNDRIEVDGATFRGTVALTLGTGNDDVFIEQGNNARVTRFEKAVTINADGGDDIIRIGLPADNTDFADFQAGLTMNGGTGLDIARFKNGALGGTRFNTFFSAPVVSLFELQE